MVMKGKIYIRTGGGNDTVLLNDSELDLGSVLIDTGIGNDTVLVDTAVQGMTSDYATPVKISLGAGDDFLQLGNEVLNGNNGEYLKAVTLNGGAGNDELSYFSGGNTFTIAPKITLFESIH